jgi:hypothetical protein
MIHHKPSEVPLETLPDYFTHIQSGKDVSKEDLGILSDNTGDNISKLNPHFGEMSVHYWVWKNRRDTEHVGFQHYRRFFNFNPKYPLPQPNHGLSFKLYKRLIRKMISPEFILKDLQTASFIFPEKVRCKPTISEHYKLCHNPKDWELFMSFLDKKLTPEYKAFIPAMSSDTHLHACLLFIARFEEFDRYMTWLFDLLFDLYEQLDPPIDGYQSRSLAYLTERLLHLFILAEQDLRPGSIKTRSYPCFGHEPPRLKDLFTYW